MGSTCGGSYPTGTDIARSSSTKALDDGLLEARWLWTINPGLFGTNVMSLVTGFESEAIRQGLIGEGTKK
jgi:hypothetical protein